MKYYLRLSSLDVAVVTILNCKVVWWHMCDVVVCGKVVGAMEKGRKETIVVLAAENTGTHHRKVVGRI